MNTPAPQTKSIERPYEPNSGWLMLLGVLGFPVLTILFAVVVQPPEGVIALLITGSVLTALIMLAGFYVVGPNMCRVLVLFGNYRGSVRKQGFFWTHPFTLKHKLSLKAHNVASEKIKVNDQDGNPIEIGAVVVWQVRDTAQALFDVEDYTEYVDIQIEAAVRQLASSHPYDEHSHSGAISLRGDSTEVAEELGRMLGERLERAGIQVLEARLSHLAYAPEIASAMLQRQQAQAIIAARSQIVEGAVSMVEHALNDLRERKVVELDAAGRATLVSNLLVVLCGQASPTPVLNTGAGGS